MTDVKAFQGRRTGLVRGRPPLSGPPGEGSGTGNSKPVRGLFAGFAKGVK